MRQSFSRSGQVGIAIMLMMVIMSTVGFALATRASRDVQTSRQGQDAVQSFTAAEATIEEVLSQTELQLESAPSSGNFSEENLERSYSLVKQGEQTVDLEQGLTIEIPLSLPGQGVTGITNQQIAIEWTAAGTTDCSANPASLMVNIINASGVVRSIAAGGCSRNDNITVPSTPPTLLGRRLDITLSAGDTLIRVTPLYNDTPVLITGLAGFTLPTQQYQIIGRATTAESRETKAIQVDRTRDFAPTVLNYALISGTTITK